MSADRTDPLVWAPDGRRWGEHLWPNGPIMGGPNWREFAAERNRRIREEAPLPKIRTPDRGVWE